jgi:predicted phage terminase large subunit-like protein
LTEVLELKATTPELTWSGTYQGVPTPPGGYIFKRTWWKDNRYDIQDQAVKNLVYARYISWDTAEKAKEEHDYSAFTVAELWPDYRLGIRRVQQMKLEFPDLTAEMEHQAKLWNFDGKLHGILIEDKSSGTSALQTLAASAQAWLRPLLIPFIPTTDKVTKGNQAAVWCKNGSVLLPIPSEHCPWLIDFEDELFSFPQVKHDHRTDTFTQLILYLEHILSAGYEARGGQEA